MSNTRLAISTTKVLNALFTQAAHFYQATMEGRPIKLNYKLTGHRGLYIRAESGIDIKQVVFQGLPERGSIKKYEEGDIKTTALQRYLEESTDLDVGYGGCGSVKDMMNFMKANSHKLDNTCSLIITHTGLLPLEQDIKGNKVSLHDANLICLHENIESSRSYEKEVLLIGKLDPQQMIAVIPACHIEAFLKGSRVYNMLSINPKVKTSEYICIEETLKLVTQQQIKYEMAEEKHAEKATKSPRI